MYNLISHMLLGAGSQTIFTQMPFEKDSFCSVFFPNYKGGVFFLTIVYVLTLLI